LSNQRDKSIGAMFHSQTKYRRGVLPGATGKAVSTIKVYANPLEVAALPVPDINGGKGVWEALALGRVAIPEGGRLRQREISQILWATAGFNRGGQRTYTMTAALSGLETYLVTRQIEDIFAGVYHYNPREHSLEYLQRGDPSLALRDALLGDVGIDAYAAVIVYTGIPSRVDDAAKSRAYRYLYLEAGAAGQCAMVAAVSLGLVATARAEFYDDELARLLQLDGRSEFPLNVVTIGT